MDTSKSSDAVFKYLETGSVKGLGEANLTMLDPVKLAQRIDQRVKHYMREFRNVTMKTIHEVSSGDLHLSWDIADERAIKVRQIDTDPWKEADVTEWYITRDGRWLRITFGRKSLAYKKHEWLWVDTLITEMTSLQHGNAHVLMTVLQALTGFAEQNKQATKERADAAESLADELTKECLLAVNLYK